jgi:hypothetical protein
MEGYVYVDPPALSPHSVRAWVQLALPYVRTLAPKPARRSSPGRKTARRAK